jgi:hypothetical protein
MIRDPSDGSVKPEPDVPALKAKHGENWGLKTLDKPERKPKPAPTAEELKAHYAKFDLAFQPKHEGE